MKKILMFATMASTLLVSCSSEELIQTKESEVSRKELSFTVGGIVSKAGIVAGATFTDVNTKVGIFVVNNVSGEKDYEINETNPFKIAEFHPALTDGAVATDKDWICGSEKKISLSGQIAKLYAYYPYDELAIGDVLSTGKMKVKLDEPTSFDGSNQVDYMYANSAKENGVPVLVSSSNTKANLFFHHAFAKINFKVIKDASFVAPECLLKSIKLSTDVLNFQFIKTNSGGSSTINLETGAFEVTEPATFLTFTNNDIAVSVGSVTHSDIQALVVPIPALPPAPADGAELNATNSIKITMNVNNVDISGYLPFAALASKWEAGKNYVYTIRVTGAKLIVDKTVSVVKWDEVTASEAVVN